MNFDILTPQSAIGILLVGLFCIAWIDFDLRIKRQK